MAIHVVQADSPKGTLTIGKQWSRGRAKNGDEVLTLELIFRGDSPYTTQRWAVFTRSRGGEWKIRPPSKGGTNVIDDVAWKAFEMFKTSAFIEELLR